MSGIIHLHNHTQHSLMDGLTSTDELAQRAVDEGDPAIACTDHGVVSSHRLFQTSCENAGIKPIFGNEMYLSPTNRFDRSAGKDKSINAYNHIIVLAQNQQGLKNLNKLSELSWVEGFYNKPRIDREILEQYGENLILLSGCLNGVIAKAIFENKPEMAEEWTKWFKEKFDDNFYMELQPDNPKNINDELYRLASINNIKCVATADTHFPNESDRAVEECMLILSTSPKRNHDEDYDSTKDLGIFEKLNKLYPERKMTFEKLDLYVQGKDLMNKKFIKQGIIDDSLFTNTFEIMDKVEECGYASGLDLLPQPKTDPKKTLRRLVYAEMKVKGTDKDPNHVKRIETELKVISDKEFDPYFLMVYDTIKWAKDQGIRVGPGRGSCIGSDVCYHLGITTIDPLEYNLLFFRFIDPNRPDWPDIDIDVQDDRRNEVIEYLRKKFKNVASISTYSKFKDKGLIKDVSRVLGVPLAEVNKAVKGVHKFEDFETDNNVKWFHDKYPEVLEYSRKLRGRIRNVGIHASGIVVSKEPIENYAPIETRTDDKDKVSGRKAVIGLDMHEAEDVGLIKLDILGLKNLAIIDKALESIKLRHNIDIDLENMDLEDKNIYEGLSAGHTVGVFQASETAYTKLLKEMKPEGFDHLILSNALVRPGAANTVGPMVISRMHGLEPVNYTHEIMKSFTEMSYGLVVFQEDVMLTCTELAGMSMEDASGVRKIIGKKLDPKLFEEYKGRFLEGAAKHVELKVAKKLWDNFEEFAGYGFNKSHSVGYSLITYWTAWLKHYYPLEYMFACLTKELDSDKITTYLIECKRLGIKITLPHVNLSETKFTLQEDRIVFGLSNVKYLSDISADKIIKKRPFESFSQLQEAAAEKNSGITTRMLASLNKVGAAAFDDNLRNGNEQDNYWEYLNIPKFSTNKLPDHVSGLITQMEDYDDQSFLIFMGLAHKAKRGNGWSRVEFVDESGKVGLFDKEESEVEMGQMYLIGALGNKLVTYMTIDDFLTGQSKSTLAILLKGVEVNEGKYFVLSFSKRKTKAGKFMGHLTLVNSNNEVRTVLVFPNTFPKIYTHVKEGSVVNLTFNNLDNGELCVKDVIL